MKATTTLKLLAKVPREHLIALIEPERLDELLEQLADQFTFHPGGEPASANDAPPISSEALPPPASDFTTDDLQADDAHSQVYGALPRNKGLGLVEIAKELGASRTDVRAVLLELERRGCVEFAGEDLGWRKHPTRTLKEALAEPLPGDDDNATSSDAQYVAEALEELAEDGPLLAAEVACHMEWTWARADAALTALVAAGGATLVTEEGRSKYAIAPKPKAEPKPATPKAKPAVTVELKDAALPSKPEKWFHEQNRVEDAVFKVLDEKRGALSVDAIARFADIPSSASVAQCLSRLTKRSLVTQGPAGWAITDEGRREWGNLKIADEVAASPEEETVTAVLRALPGVAWNAEGILGRVPTPVVMTLGLTLAKVIVALGVLKQRGLAKENHAEGWFYTAAGIEAKNGLPEDEAWLAPAPEPSPTPSVTTAAILEQLRGGPKTVAQLASHFEVGVDFVRRPIEELVRTHAVDVVGRGRWTKYASASAPPVVEKPEAKPKATRRKKGEQLVVPGA